MCLPDSPFSLPVPHFLHRSPSPSPFPASLPSCLILLLPFSLPSFRFVFHLRTPVVRVTAQPWPLCHRLVESQAKALEWQSFGAFTVLAACMTLCLRCARIPFIEAERAASGTNTQDRVPSRPVYNSHVLEFSVLRFPFLGPVVVHPAFHSSVLSCN